MTTLGFAVVGAGAVFGLGGPLAVGHYERAPSDRLDDRMAAAIALTCSFGVAVLLGRVVFDPGPNLLSFGFGVGLGAIFGLAGVGIYGVLERLVLPVMSRYP